MTTGSRSESPNDLKLRLSDIEQRIRAFKDGSTFRSEHAERLEVMHRRRATIGEKIDAAIARGDRWDMARDEFARDCQGISDELTELVVGAGEGH